MYNPFGEVVMREVLAALEASIKHEPRQIRLIYANPIHMHVFDKFELIELVEEFSYRFEERLVPVRLYRSRSCGVTEPPGLKPNSRTAELARQP
jgi:hypothetical protein